MKTVSDRTCLIPKFIRTNRKDKPMTQTIQSLRDQDTYQKSIERQVQDDIATKTAELIDVAIRIQRLKKLFIQRNLRHNEVAYLFLLAKKMSDLLERRKDGQPLD